MCKTPPLMPTEAASLQRCQNSLRQPYCSMALPKDALMDEATDCK